MGVVESMGVVSRRWVSVESMGVVVRRYIDFLILLILTPLVSTLFSAASLLFVLIKLLITVRAKEGIEVPWVKLNEGIVVPCVLKPAARDNTCLSLVRRAQSS